MGVYIPNMEMPECCGDCPLNYDMVECLLADIKFWRGGNAENFDMFNGRHPRCPIVHVPPHGRLGDLDALMQHEILLLREGGRLPIIFASNVRNAPTIIPAEGRTE